MKKININKSLSDINIKWFWSEWMEEQEYNTNLQKVINNASQVVKEALINQISIIDFLRNIKENHEEVYKELENKYFEMIKIVNNDHSLYLDNWNKQKLPHMVDYYSEKIQPLYYSEKQQKTYNLNHRINWNIHQNSAITNKWIVNYSQIWGNKPNFDDVIFLWYWIYLNTKNEVK